MSLRGLPLLGNVLSPSFAWGGYVYAGILWGEGFLYCLPLPGVFRGFDMECVLCKGDIDVQIHGWDQGHNAQPLAEGRCCSDCNGSRVIPARIRQVMEDDVRRKAEKAWKHADTTD